MAPNSGALWGTSKFDKGWEAQMGRKFDIVHFYHQWSQSFPTAEERALAAEGRLLLINWKSPGSWPAVANGSQDAQITATANRLKAFGKKVFLAFHHEPENDIGGAGQPADYARAFRRVVDGFNRVGADNVLFVWNMMGFVGGHGDIYPTLYPGDQYVDWIAYDPYNWYGCKAGHKTRSFAEITKPFYDWTAAHAPGKPLMLAEYGLREQPAGLAEQGRVVPRLPGPAQDHPDPDQGAGLLQQPAQVRLAHHQLERLGGRLPRHRPRPVPQPFALGCSRQHS